MPNKEQLLKLKFLKKNEVPPLIKIMSSSPVTQSLRNIHECD